MYEKCSTKTKNNTHKKYDKTLKTERDYFEHPAGQDPGRSEPPIGEGAAFLGASIYAK